MFGTQATTIIAFTLHGVWRRTPRIAVSLRGAAPKNAGVRGAQPPDIGGGCMVAQTPAKIF